MLIRHMRTGETISIGRKHELRFERVELATIKNAGSLREATKAVFSLSSPGPSVALSVDGTMTLAAAGEYGGIHEAEISVRDVRPDYVEIGITAPRSVRIY